MKRVVIAASLALLAAACSKSDKEGMEGSKEAKGADAGTTISAPVLAHDSGSLAVTAADAGAVALDSFPSPARAERKAERQISKANYKSELEKIDHEVGP